MADEMKKKIGRMLLKFFLMCYDFSYRKASAFAIRYYGFHPKHKFGGFHLFFLEHIFSGAKVLDIGCSNGELTADLAGKASQVVAYDISRKSIEKAKVKNMRENIHYFVGDAIKDMPSGQFDVVVCSNILEHLQETEVFLRKLHSVTDRLLIRVPNSEGNWISAVKSDLGISYFLDPQHKREYSPVSLCRELEAGGWKMETMQISAELWVVAKDADKLR